MKTDFQLSMEELILHRSLTPPYQIVLIGAYLTGREKHLFLLNENLDILIGYKTRLYPSVKIGCSEEPDEIVDRLGHKKNFFPRSYSPWSFRKLVPLVKRLRYQQIPSEWLVSKTVYDHTIILLEYTKS